MIALFRALQCLAVFEIETHAGGGCYMRVGGKSDAVLSSIIQIMIARLRALENLVCERGILLCTHQRTCLKWSNGMSCRAKWRAT